MSADEPERDRVGQVWEHRHAVYLVIGAPCCNILTVFKHPVLTLSAGWGSAATGERAALYEDEDAPLESLPTFRRVA